MSRAAGDPDRRAWEPDRRASDPDRRAREPRADDGRWGSQVGCVGGDGASYDPYVWYDLTSGAPIAPAAPDERSVFEIVVLPGLRERWERAGCRLVDTAGRVWDVRGFVERRAGYPLGYVGIDGDAYLVTLVADTTGEPGTRVRCALRVRDVDAVTVERAEPC